MQQSTEPKEKKDLPQKITNDPDEAMSTPEKVQESNDNKIDEDFPGYPHYPAKDDILNPENNVERVEIDVDNISLSNISSNIHSPKSKSLNDVAKDIQQGDILANEENNKIPNDLDITEEDLILLGSKDDDMDNGEDETLKSHGWVPSSGEDIDLPKDENEEEIPGMEDEENDYYSLGGDDKSGLEENNEQHNV